MIPRRTPSAPISRRTTRNSLEERAWSRLSIPTTIAARSTAEIEAGSAASLATKVARNIVSTIAAAALLLSGTVGIAQSNQKARLNPITAPLRHAGVYHVATGTWTRGATLPDGTGPATLYDNSCNVVYFTSMLSTERWQHRSRLPANDTDATPDPTTNSVFYGTSDSNHRYDERPGCNDHYTINGFEVGYCSSHVGTLTWTYEFAHSYTACGASDMIPNYTIAVTGMPGGTPSGAQNCWIVDIDVSNETGSNMVLTADGNGTYEGPSTVDQFGWSFEVAPADAAEFTGPMIAGNFTWTGGIGIQFPCTGTDGTIWDSTVVGGGPTPAGETLGTGMSSNDFFRMAGGPVSGASGPGCYSFGGNPHADFYLKLYGGSNCICELDLLGCGGGFVKFCAPGVGGIVSCPCGNPQIPAGATKGCNNFAGGGSGGAILAASGTAVTDPNDTVGFNLTAGVGSNVTILFQGTMNTVNTRSGAGVRCVGGILKRLYKGDQSSGAIAFPNNGVQVHLQSQAVGYTIVAPITLYYYCAYRNAAANGQPGCPGLNFGFNTTNAGSIAWAP